MASEDPIRHATFPLTRWSLVGRAAGPLDGAARAALDELVVRYLPALRAHLVQARRLRAEDADDILQDFLARRVLEQNLLNRADPGRGTFRGFLLAALRNFLVDSIRAARGKAPPGGAISLEDERMLDPGDPKQDLALSAYEVAWARGVVARATSLMQQQCEAEGRLDVWNVFEARIVIPAHDGLAPIEYDELIARLGLASIEQAWNLLTTGKRTFNRCLRLAVAEYTDEENIDEEVRELRAILGQANVR